jgi:hypothetical protein
MIGVFQSAGFTNVSITHRFECFVGTTKERTARKYGVIGVNVSAIRGNW